ncbi:protein disulfide-isomerase A6 homolog [Branchiostoma lanceolatum]|uniref:protein disulfide-isomerase A6 homolog n=1 Tax=Branchiostoma lanceolatum TaxID=7740 RepID=UPI003451A2C2
MEITTGWLVVAFLAATAHALYGPADDVKELTAKNFKKMVLKSDEIWMVKFYSPGCSKSKKLAKEWKKAATALKGAVKVGAVDMDAHGSAAKPYKVSETPTIKVFGANKKKPTDYEGKMTAAAIEEAGMMAALMAGKFEL